METLDLEENRIQYTVLRLRGKSLADENYHFHVVFPKSCCASLASLLCGATKAKEFAANSIINIGFILASCHRARTYLQPHYGNGFFGNVYLSAGQH